MGLKIAFAVVVITAFIVPWIKWFREMHKAKKELDAQIELTLSIMQQAFQEARDLQSDIDKMIRHHV